MNANDSGSGEVERQMTGLERTLREDLDRFRLESAIARQDASAELMRDLQQSASIDLGDVATAINRLEGSTIPSFGDLENLLSSKEADIFQLEGKLLSDLLREGIEGQSVLSKGIVFLKHRRYASAIEWWVLNRRGLIPEKSKLHLLLLIMEAMTHNWSGDKASALAIQSKISAHPLYRRQLPKPD